MNSVIIFVRTVPLFHAGSAGCFVLGLRVRVVITIDLKKSFWSSFEHNWVLCTQAASKPLPQKGLD
eukprot:1789423-Amphidinium_carterae.1